MKIEHDWRLQLARMCHWTWNHLEKYQMNIRHWEITLEGQYLRKRNATKRT